MELVQEMRFNAIMIVENTIYGVRNMKTGGCVSHWYIRAVLISEAAIGETSVIPEQSAH